MLSRRTLFRYMAVLGLAAGCPLPRLSFASARTDRRFVLVILRGGLDGLAAVPPHGDREYRSARRGLSLPGLDSVDGAVDLDGFFGLHPALEPLFPMYRKGELLALHAIATPYRDRSHFDARSILENGTTAANSTQDGWLNRALAGFGEDGGELGLAIGQAVPFVLLGDRQVGAWAPTLLPDVGADFLQMVAAMYRPDPVLGPALTAGLDARARAEAALGPEDRMSGRQAFGAQAMTALARVAGHMLAAADGPRIAVLEASGWDTHANQGLTSGTLARRLGDLAVGLLALQEGLASAWPDTAVLIVTEFGRTVFQNGTRGTDHGTAGIALLADGAVRGGRVVTDWPGLASHQLHDGRDLKPTLDMRAVFKAMLRDHIGLPESLIEDTVFPDSRTIRPVTGLLHS